MPLRAWWASCLFTPPAPSPASILTAGGRFAALIWLRPAPHTDSTCPLPSYRLLGFPCLIHSRVLVFSCGNPPALLALAQRPSVSWSSGGCLLVTRGRCHLDCLLSPLLATNPLAAAPLYSENPCILTSVLIPLKSRPNNQATQIQLLATPSVQPDKSLVGRFQALLAKLDMEPSGAQVVVVPGPVVPR